MSPQRPLKILHLLSQRPDSTGSGIYVQAMLRESGKRGHSNCLVAGIQENETPYLDCIDDDHCRFVRFGETDIPLPIVGMSDVMPYASSRWCDLSPDELNQYERAFRYHLSTAMTTFTPDLIHSHHLWLATSLTRQMFPTVPLVATCHGSDLRQFQNCQHLQARVLRGCRGLDAVMALSEAQKQTIVDLYDLTPQRVHVVGGGYDDRCFVQARKPDPPPVRIVYAGKLSGAKGVPWMLRALSQIRTFDWHLDLVGGGSGTEQADCLELADTLGDRVTVHGMVSQVRLAELMKNAHLFVLPSLFEGLPLVVLEALACGCRVIATRLPGVTEILGDLRTDFIELVAMPRLVDVDRPVNSDEGTFEADLKAALQNQIQAAMLLPQIDLSCIEARMAAFSWNGVFDRVERVYLAQAGPIDVAL